jgi:transcriptional regulator with XRE-family HTH domain
VSAPADPDPALASTIRRLRKRRGQSQEDFAFEAGLTVGALGRIERRKSNPTWTNVRKIASAFGLSLAEFGASIDGFKPDPPSRPRRR